MFSLFFCSTFVLLDFFILEIQGQCRNLRFTIDLIPGYRLKNYLIRTVDVSNEDSCQLQCYIEPNCVSYNFNKEEEANRLHRCDLNNATYQHDNETSGDLAKNQNYVYREAENACAKKPCQNNATCQAGFTDRDYQCLCIPGFTGHDCENEELRFRIICEGRNGKITCQNGKKISIQDANYGRLNRDTCLHAAMSSINCRARNSLQIMRDKCNGKSECQVLAVSSVFDGDPCGGTYKYLKVKYWCLEL